MTAFIKVEWCLARFPTGVPDGVTFLDIEITPTIVHGDIVVTIPCEAAEFGILVETVAAGCVADE